jgi:N utilization substance protein B
VSDSTQPNRSQATTQKPSMAARKKARRLAMQALYQWHIAQNNLSAIEAQFIADNDMSQVDLNYFRKLLHGVPKVCSHLDEHLEPLLDRSIHDITPVELSILRLGAYELSEITEVPYRVVINEGIELAKKFGATDGHKFVNGILDRLSKKFRPQEITAYRSR